MRWQRGWFVGVALGVVGLSGAVVWSQEGSGQPRETSPYLAAPAQVVAVRAGRLFDAKTGRMLSNQVVLIKGDRVADIGPSVPIPPGARVIDLGGATVLPGMIDAHVHVGQNLPNESVEHRTMIMVQSAQRDLDAGFTTVVDMD